MKFSHHVYLASGVLIFSCALLVAKSFIELPFFPRSNVMSEDTSKNGFVPVVDKNTVTDKGHAAVIEKSKHQNVAKVAMSSQQKISHDKQPSAKLLAQKIKAAFERDLQAKMTNDTSAKSLSAKHQSLTAVHHVTPKHAIKHHYSRVHRQQKKNQLVEQQVKLIHKQVNKKPQLAMQHQHEQLNQPYSRFKIARYDIE